MYSQTPYWVCFVSSPCLWAASDDLINLRSHFQTARRRGRWEFNVGAMTMVANAGWVQQYMRLHPKCFPQTLFYTHKPTREDQSLLLLFRWGHQSFVCPSHDPRTKITCIWQRRACNSGSQPECCSWSVCVFLRVAHLLNQRTLLSLGSCQDAWDFSPDHWCVSSFQAVHESHWPSFHF